MPDSANAASSLDFILVPECVSNLECLDRQSKKSNIEIIDVLSNSKLKRTAHSRLVDHITSHASLNLSHCHGKCMTHNLRQISVILKMTNMRVSDEMLHTINWNDYLLSNKCQRNHEVVKVE